MWRGAAIDQGIILRLPSCRPVFESQTNHLSFYFIYSQICAIFVIVLWKNENKQKEGWFVPIFKFLDVIDWMSFQQINIQVTFKI